MLDVNINRAREGLRVVEDYARFALDSKVLCEQLKKLRHELMGAVGPYLQQAAANRDTQGDVGTEVKTDKELRREGLGQVVLAAGKRVGEAVRVIEELLKALDPAAASQVEKVRYGFYSIEQRVVGTLARGKRFAGVRLYVLITESVCSRPWFEVAAEAIEGGADCIQLREKELEGGELLCRAKRLVELCRERGVISIVNDRPDVALLAGADGVHVGQGDLPCAEVRRVVGPEMIVGVSTHNIEQARQAVLDGADYIGVGPVFPSGTKPRDILPGLDYAREVARSIQIPAVAIAGITEDRVDSVLETGIRAIAVTAAVVGCADVRLATERMKRKLVGQTFLSVPSAANPTAPELEKRRRHLPHWTLAGSTYFLTFRIGEGELSGDERDLLLQQLKDGHGKFYELFGAVIMPDHVHIVLKPNENVELWRIMKGIKGSSARRINEMRGARGMIWQDESFDRIIRDQAELDEKMQYMLNNPVKRGIVGDAWQYRWFLSGPR